jgi:outer membrane protein
MIVSRARFALSAALLLPLGGGLPQAAAQTLPEALAMSYGNNPTLLAARAQLRAVDENVPQALAGWRPTVTVSGAASQADGNNRGLSAALDRNAQQVWVYPPAVPSTLHVDRTVGNAQFVIQQPLFRGGRTVSSTRRAENQVMAQRARLLNTEQQVMADSVQAYVNVIRDQEKLRLFMNNEQVLTEQLRATNERFRVGEITRTDVAQAESRLAQARAQRALSEGNLQISRATFQRVIGQAPQRLLAPQPLRPPIRNASDAAQVASISNPLVVAALFDEASARDFIDVQVSQLMPQVNAIGLGQRFDNTNTPHTRSSLASIGAQVSIPIYQGGIEYSQIRQARQQASSARQVVDDQRRIAVEAATRAWEQLQSSKAQVESVRVAIRAQEIALDGVQREAIVGSRTTLDVLNAENELLNQRQALIDALSTLVYQSFVLAQAIGRLTAQDLGLDVDPYDMRAYYNAVRNRWVGLSDYSAGQSGAR